MTEKLLQYIWKHQYFNRNALELVSGEPISIEYPGEENTDQGPDFTNARIRIQGSCWIGSVELHVYASGWTKHSHSADSHYHNVILHVFWKQDRVDADRNIPQLELYHRVSRMMLETYNRWMNKPIFIPCELSVSGTNCRDWENWASQLLMERLNRKMQGILDSLHVNHYHWEEQLWRMIAANFGIPVNTGLFEAVARSIPFSLLAKNRHHPIQLEALLLGQANLLERNFSEPYPVMLKKEFIFLKKKYGLKKIFEPVHLLRMRPENFPAIRLSQLAALFRESTPFFSWILACNSLLQLKKKLMVRANDYWQCHYVFEKTSPFREKMMGEDMRHNIIINTIIPILYTYGKITPDPPVLQKALSWLEQLPDEKNRHLAEWKRIGIRVKKAAGSQALSELKKQYCDQRKCLECEIGKKILQPESAVNPG